MGYVARMGERITALKTFDDNPKVTDLLGELGRY
jgi:hypothetical protein